MSRVAKAPIEIPAGVAIKIDGQVVSVKGKNGELTCKLNRLVDVKQEENLIKFQPKNEVEKTGWSQAGTARALVNSMVVGVVSGFTKKLQLVGVGFRAQLKGDTLSLSLGFSHPVEYKLPAGIKAECPSQTEIVISGIDKQLVGQAAADIRAFRRPEPYKGKGVRYSDEVVRTKEAKKK